MTDRGSLQDLTDRLEQTAAHLRAGDLSAERAAALVDECARLAAEAGSQLDRETRAHDEGAASGQLPLDGR